MPKISALPLATSVTGDDLAVIVQGGATKKAAIDTFPISDLVQTALDGKQPLDSDLTAYAGAADAAARRALIGAETAGAAATVQGNLTTHEALTSAHGATSANTASRIVARSATGTATLSGVVIDTAATPTQVAGMLSWNATEETIDVGISATEGLSIGAELTPRYRNDTGSTLAAGAAVYISGSTGTFTNVALAQANALLPSRDCIGIVTTDAGIASNQRGRVCTYGVSHNHNTSAFADGAEVWLSPTVAGGLTATEPTTAGHFKVLIGKVQRSHATLGQIFVDPHFLGSVTGDGVSSAVSQAAARTALGLGTLATQSGTFSGTSSGTNTGDQTATTVSNTPAGGIAATTVQSALNELDTEKANLASPTFTGNPLAPTPATTDNDTSIATTAMVQAVANAQWTQPTALAITAAGNSNVVAATAQNRYLTQRVNVTAFTGTATVTLQNTSALAGDKRRLIVAMPAGFANLIELRNLTSGGTLLATVPMDGALARTWVGYSTFDGTNWGAVSFSPMSVDEFVLSRTISRGDYIQIDGATANRAAGIYGPFDAVNNPREWVAGAASLTIEAVVTVPTSNPAASAYISWHGSSSTSASTANNLYIFLSGGTSVLSIRQGGATFPTDVREFAHNTFRSTYSGQTGLLKVYFVRGTTNPAVTWNGVDISASFTLTTNNPPAWLDASMVPTYRLVGYNWPSGPAPIVTPILGQTSAEDDAFYMATGKWPAWVVRGGHSTSDSKPTTGTYAYWYGTGSISGATATSFNIVAGASGLAARNVGSYTFIGGSMLQVTVTASGLDSAALISAQGVITSTGGSISNGTTTVQLRIQEGGVGHMAFDSITSAAGGSISITKVITCGALSLPSVQPINVLDDVSGIGGNQGRMLGCSPVTDKTAWRISANTWTSGNQQILAGSILDSTKDVIDLVEQSTTGTPTTTIGSASAGSGYKSSSALSAGINPITLVTRKLASNDIWVNSNSTAVVRTTLTGHRTN